VRVHEHPGCMNSVRMTSLICAIVCFLLLIFFQQPIEQLTEKQMFEAFILLTVHVLLLYVTGKYCNRLGDIPV